jgi:hypothetical protein
MRSTNQEQRSCAEPSSARSGQSDTDERMSWEPDGHAVSMSMSVVLRVLLQCTRCLRAYSGLIEPGCIRRRDMKSYF